MKESEQNTLLTNKDVDVKYPGLKGAVNRASRVVTDVFRPFRSDVDALKTPLLICDDTKLRQDVDRAMRDSTREDRPEDRRSFQFLPLSGVILVSDAHLLEMTAAGTIGFHALTVGLAHEYIHAMSTFGTETSTRTGFSNIPYPRHPHVLEPGKIYEHDLEVGDPNAPIFIEDPREIRLTENFTNLAVNLMLKRLLPDAGREFTFLCLSTYEDPKKVTIAPISNALLAATIQALVVGDEDVIVKGPDGRKVLEALNMPKAIIYAFSKVPPTVEDMYNINLFPPSFSS